MSGARQRGNWTWDAYLEWEAGQSIRYELVDGEVYAMTGGTTAHDIVCNNLRGEPCRFQGPDLKVKVGRNGRYPDAWSIAAPSCWTRKWRKSRWRCSRFYPKAQPGLIKG